MERTTDDTEEANAYKGLSIPDWQGELRQKLVDDIPGSHGAEDERMDKIGKIPLSEGLWRKEC